MIPKPEPANEIIVSLHHRVRTAVEPSPRVLEVASMFGLGVDEEREMEIVPPCTIPLRSGEVVFITGPSGSGKSTLLRLIENAVPRAVRFEDVTPESDRPMIEQVGDTLAQATEALAIAGLADAFVMLRKPSELSDGQRYRMQLARLIDAVRHQPDEPGFPIILADEFGATLDRLTAQVVARNIARWVRQTKQVCFVAATTHDDLLEALKPEVLVYQPLGECVEVHERADGRDS